MNYDDALTFIHSTNKFGMKLGLENMGILLNLLDNPQENLKFLHIAGTNGKGSTSALLYNILKEQGYRVGLYVSPYLEEFTERIQIDGMHIKRDDLAVNTLRVKKAIDIMVSKKMQHPTEFEIVTAVGLLYFAQKKVDFVVLEVGLGGRLDATNIISSSEVSIITSIGLDHMEQLGNSLEKIAAEKAGIIKQEGRVVVYPQSTTAILDVIKDRALERKADIYVVDKNDITLLKSSLDRQVFSYNSEFISLPRVEMSLLGRHQIYNVATALKSIEVLLQRGHKISKGAIIRGIKNTNWPGRFEILSKQPIVLLDGAHNPQGAEAFYEAIVEYFPSRKIILILGILQDKPIIEMIRVLLPIAKEIITITPNNPRAMAAKVLAENIKTIEKEINVSSMESIEEAVNFIKSCGKEEIIAFTGSLYMIGDVRKVMRTQRT